jgi:hypothetical protein
MPFSTDLALLVASQLSRFVTLNRHQLAGQVANLDFWLDQVRNGLAAIDGYGKRFHQMKVAQTKHVKEHHTTEFSLDDPCCTQGMPAPPRKVPEQELQAARQALCDATRRFLRRCTKDGLIPDATLREACANLDLNLVSTD